MTAPSVPDSNPLEQVPPVTEPVADEPPSTYALSRESTVAATLPGDPVTRSVSEGVQQDEAPDSGAYRETIPVWEGTPEEQAVTAAALAAAFEFAFKVTPPNPESPPEVDRRVYIPAPEGWQAHLKTDWEKDYCHLRAPGQEYFHLLLQGEVYLQYGSQKICLSCAVRRGIATHDRLYWQRGIRKTPPMPF